MHQVFFADASDWKCVSDITDLPTESSCDYRAIVLDLFSRKDVGWSMADSLATTLLSTALKTAIEFRQAETR